MDSLHINKTIWWNKKLNLNLETEQQFLDTPNVGKEIRSPRSEAARSQLVHQV